MYERGLQITDPPPPHGEGLDFPGPRIQAPALQIFVFVMLTVGPSKPKQGAAVNLIMKRPLNHEPYACVYSLGSYQTKYKATRKPYVYILVFIP